MSSLKAYHMSKAGSDCLCDDSNQTKTSTDINNNKNFTFRPRDYMSKIVVDSKTKRKKYLSYSEKQSAVRQGVTEYNELLAKRDHLKKLSKEQKLREEFSVTGALSEVLENRDSSSHENDFGFHTSDINEFLDKEEKSYKDAKLQADLDFGLCNVVSVIERIGSNSEDWRESVVCLTEADKINFAIKTAFEMDALNSSGKHAENKQEPNIAKTSNRRVHNFFRERIFGSFKRKPRKCETNSSVPSRKVRKSKNRFRFLLWYFRNDKRKSKRISYTEDRDYKLEARARRTKKQKASGREKTARHQTQGQVYGDINETESQQKNGRSSCEEISELNDERDILNVQSESCQTDFEQSQSVEETIGYAQPSEKSIAQADLHEKEVVFGHPIKIGNPHESLIELEAPQTHSSPIEKTVSFENGETDKVDGQTDDTDDVFLDEASYNGKTKKQSFIRRLFSKRDKEEILATDDGSQVALTEKHTNKSNNEVIDVSDFPNRFSQASIALSLAGHMDLSSLLDFADGIVKEDHEEN